METDSPCEVEVLGTKTPTFHVAGHHYALVRIDGLTGNEVYEYEVHLDGDKVWPEPDSEYPPSRFRTYPKEKPLQVVFGSCRVAAPNEAPHNLPKDEDDRGPRDRRAARPGQADAARSRSTTGPTCC